MYIDKITIHLSIAELSIFLFSINRSQKMKWWILLLSLGLLVVAAESRDSDGDGLSDEGKAEIKAYFYNSH